MATYKVKDLPGFEHMLVVGDPWQFDDGSKNFDTVVVTTLINTSVIIGDRELKVQLPDEALFISMNHLELVPEVESQHEFASDNPFGQYKYEGRFTRGLLEVVHSVYEKAITVTIIEKSQTGETGWGKTLYSESFFSMRERALGMIEEMLHGELDPDDLVFNLRELKENDTNG